MQAGTKHVGDADPNMIDLVDGYPNRASECLKGIQIATNGTLLTDATSS